jgi:hypothetical protein
MPLKLVNPLLKVLKQLLFGEFHFSLPRSDNHFLKSLPIPIFYVAQVGVRNRTLSSERLLLFPHFVPAPLERP